MFMKNKNVLIVVAIIGVVLLLGIIWGVSTYNNLVSLKEEVTAKFKDIDVQLERRADLVPNLVNTVKGYVKHEESAIERVTKARENLLRADDVEDKSLANSELSSALNSLLVITEAYPDLKANTNFINLQDELAGTENRIATARRDFNAAAKTYNTKIKKIPTNIIAEIGDFDNIDYFEADDGKTKLPEVDFD